MTWMRWVSTMALLAGLTLSSCSSARVPADSIDRPIYPPPRSTLHNAIDDVRAYGQVGGGDGARGAAVVSPTPVIGRLRTLGSQCFADDTGCRTFSIAHQGDLAARYVWGCARGDAGQIEIARQDLRDAAAAGYAISRTWWRFDDAPGSPWFTAAYPGFEPSAIPEFLRCGADLIRYAGSLGLRITVGPGGIDKLGKQDERQLFALYRQLIDAGGHDNIAWVEALNEPSSLHATSDTDGDHEPGYLSELVLIVLN